MCEPGFLAMRERNVKLTGTWDCFLPFHFESRTLLICKIKVKIKKLRHSPNKNFEILIHYLMERIALLQSPSHDPVPLNSSFPKKRMSWCEKLIYENKHFLSKQPICKGMLQQRFNLYFSRCFLLLWSIKFQLFSVSRNYTRDHSYIQPDRCFYWLPLGYFLLAVAHMHTDQTGLSPSNPIGCQSQNNIIPLLTLTPNNHNSAPLQANFQSSSR